MAGEKYVELRALDSIRVGARYRKDLGDVDALARSIAAIGLLHPIVVTPDGQLIAGQRRLAACRQLGWQELPVRVIDIDEVVRGEYAENVVRKDFLPSEAVAIAKAVEPLEREAAASRQRATQLAGRSSEGTPVFGGGQLPRPTAHGKTRDRLAAFVGWSGRTLERAVEVVDAARREPERFAPLLAEMDKTGRVNGVFRKLTTMQQAARLQAEPPPLPRGPFRVIVADPPWPYESRSDDASHRNVIPYPSLSVPDICALPVAELACPDSLLWLWTTNSFMEQAYQVARSWGFEVKTILTWVKHRMGTGDWLRGQTEHCLLAVRGHPTVTLTNQTTVLRAEAREHSRKPDAFYRLVERLCPGSKVELFARAPRPGWVSHGDQTTLFAASD